MIVVIWFLLCLGALLLMLLAAGLFVKGRNREQQDAVMSRFASGAGDQVRDDAPKKQSQNPIKRYVLRRQQQAGFSAESNFLSVTLIVLVVVSLLISISAGAVAGLMTAVAGLLLIHVYLLNRSSRRQRILCSQLPDFMDRLLRPLIAGNTIDEAFAIATRESPEPIRGLFMSVARQLRFGAPLEDALAQTAEVHDLTDLHALAMATRVHRQYGGSIRNMIKSLISMARSRETSAQELRALTAETRMSAWVLVAVPVAITVFILLRNPEYYSAMWSSLTGRSVLLAGFGMQFLGAIVIWRMMRKTVELQG